MPGERLAACCGFQRRGCFGPYGQHQQATAVPKALLEACKRGDYGVVVVHSLDRWSRNLQVTLESFKLLADHRVAFASITEQIDYSTPEGRLFIAMLGAFAQYYSDSLAKHTTKGMKQRAMSGYQNGSVPFGYERCSEDCPKDHRGKVHVVANEGEAVRKLFEHYATGTWTVAQLASWLNEQGFRTRNTKTVMNGLGEGVKGPRLFTIYSVRWILHNPFFIGKVTYRDETFQGMHEPLISESLFQQVQDLLRAAKKTGRSRGTSYRAYLLKALARCVWCGYPLWSDLVSESYTVYREGRAAHSVHDCPASGKQVACSKIDPQMDQVISSLVIDPQWRSKILARMEQVSDVAKVLAERGQLKERLRRLGRSFVDGLVEESEYSVQRKLLQDRFDSLVVPELNAAYNAGEVLESLKEVWGLATMEEKNRLLRTMLEAVYLDLVENQGVVGIAPKSQFVPLFDAAVHTSVTVSVPTEEASFPLEEGRYGGDGGESNPPSKECRPAYATSLFGALISPVPSTADNVRARPAD